MDREEIQKQIDELKNKIAELEKKLENKMEKGQYYYYVDYANRSIKTKQYASSMWDEETEAIDNVFPYTEQGEKQAERELFEFELMQKLKKFARENNEGIDWHNKGQAKWKIHYNLDTVKLESFWNSVAKEIQVYFTSEEIAQKAIDIYKEDLIRYFTEEE